MRRSAVATSVLALALIGSASAEAETARFAYTGTEQVFTVPADVSQLEVLAVGGRGNAGTDGGDGGHRGVTTGNLAVAPGETLYVLVGGAGLPGNALTGLPGGGGFNGGARGGPGYGGGGGGATDLRTISSAMPGTLDSRVLVAGGGGGGPAGSPALFGGVGGGLNGGNGDYVSTCAPSVLDGGGKGGSQTAGGGSSGEATQGGALGVGGRGGGSGGGGGGGGYYGGGGGYTCGGGGGGSGYVGPRVSGGSFTTSGNDLDGTINGSVTLTYTAEPTDPGDPGGPGDPSDPDDPDNPDPEAPETRLTDHPDRTIKAKGKTQVKFRFSSATPGASFLCSLDGVRPRSCRSPQAYSVGMGRHEFEVTASAGGQTDESPASFAFRVKRKR